MGEGSEWMGRACQQRAVLISIRKPMTCRDIFDAAVRMSPRIRLRDIGDILRQLASRGYVRCINRQPVTGSLYYLTLKARRHLMDYLKVHRSGKPKSVDWKMYAHISRGKTRKAVFLELKRLDGKTGEPQTISRVKRALTHKHPVTLNATIRAVNELLDMGAVTCVGKNEEGRIETLHSDGTRQAGRGGA